MAIQFTCPHCQTPMSVSEQYAGTSGPCRECGHTISIPGNTFATAPASFDSRPPSSFPWIAVIAAVAVGAVMMVGMLVALLLPAVQAAREAARRTACKNNHRSVAIALLSYESDHGHFPPAYLTDKDGQPMHSWRVLILPYLDEQAMFDQYDFDQPWDSPANAAVTTAMPSVYGCPSGTQESPTDTNLFAVVGPNTLFPGSQSRELSEITDGINNTVGILECAGRGTHWAAPVDLQLSDLPNVSSDHAGGAVVAMTDGSVQFLSTPPTSGMVIINDGQ